MRTKKNTITHVENLILYIKKLNNFFAEIIWNKRMIIL